MPKLTNIGYGISLALALALSGAPRNVYCQSNRSTEGTVVAVERGGYVGIPAKENRVDTYEIGNRVTKEGWLGKGWIEYLLKGPDTNENRGTGNHYRFYKSEIDSEGLETMDPDRFEVGDRVVYNESCGWKLK